MKRLAGLVTAIAVLCLPPLLHAQKSDEGNEDSKDSKTETQTLTLKRVLEVKVSPQVAEGLKKQPPIAARLKIDGELVRPVESVLVYHVVETDAYLVVDEDPQSNGEDGNEDVNILRAESSRQLIFPSGAWYYISCTCDGNWIPPGTLTVANRDYCFFERDANNKPNYDGRCIGHCEGACKKKVWGADASGKPFNR